MENLKLVLEIPDGRKFMITIDETPGKKAEEHLDNKPVWELMRMRFQSMIQESNEERGA